MKQLLFLLLMAGLLKEAAAAGSLRAAAIFSDNMVLQQGIPVKVWGVAGAGESVAVHLGTQHGEGRAGADGRWMVVLPRMEYGGPYVMEISSKGAQVRFGNVMVGEVWLASGQSNMNFSIGRPVKDVEAVAAEATRYPMIRMFTVKGQVSNRPLADVKESGWQVCDTAHIRDFSAVAYFFAKSLHLRKKVAVGIIHSSWGGTRIESWISKSGFGSDTAFGSLVKEIDGDTSDWAAMQGRAEAVEAQRNGIIAAAHAGTDQGVQSVAYADSGWTTVNYPVRAGDVKAPYYSFIWCRKSFDLPGSVIDAGWVLRLGKVLQSDITYVNGVEVGRSKEQDSSVYVVGKGLLKPGRNVVAVRILNAWGSGQLGSPADEASIASQDGQMRISLTGRWQCNAGIEPALPWGSSSSNKATGLYNGMIYPVAPYGIKGFLWYQGEGNAGNPEPYRKLQPLLIREWRKLWGEGEIPFLFVQLPGLKGAGSWPAMREAQAVSLAVPNTGMAVTIDVGDAYDVHPHNKQPVGERLALQAGHLVYHEKNVFAGPGFLGAVADGHRMRLRFSNTGSGLVLREDVRGTGFMVAGSDRVFHSAKAVVKGNEVIIYSEEVERPVAIRYAWDADPAVTLYNREGLPAAPFRGE